MVRVQNARDSALNLGRARVNEGERIAQGVGHNDRLFVRGHVQVVRLFTRRDAFFFSPSDWIDHAHIAIEGIEDENRCQGLGRNTHQLKRPNCQRQKSAN